MEFLIMVQVFFDVSLRTWNLWSRENSKTKSINPLDFWLIYKLCDIFLEQIDQSNQKQQ